MRNESSARLTESAQRIISDSFRNDEEAHTLLDLINAEFQSDPMSVQCFDLRIVARVKECVARRKAYLKAQPWMRS
jgi:hypothetical protein